MLTTMGPLEFALKAHFVLNEILEIWCSALKFQEFLKLEKKCLLCPCTAPDPSQYAVVTSRQAFDAWSPPCKTTPGLIIEKENIAGKSLANLL